MVYCPRCGKELVEKAVYYNRCKQRLNKSTSSPNAQPYEWRHRESDYMGGISFGVFLIIVALVFLNYPSIGQWFLNWFKEWRVNGPTALPMILVEPLSFFFLAFGGWGILSGFIRWGIRSHFSAAISDIVGGLFGIALGYVLREYGDGVIAWGSMLPIFIILVGGSIFLSAFFSWVFRD